MVKRITLILLTAALIFGLGTSVLAQKYRIEPKTPPIKIYKQMLLFGRMGKYEEISKSLPFVKKVLSEVKYKFDVDLEKEINIAIEKNEKEPVLTTLRKIVFYDIKDIFFTIMKEGQEESSKTLKSWLKIAELDYALLVPVIKNKAFETDAKIKKAFHLALSLLRVESSPFSAEKEEEEINFKALGKVLTGIERDILTVFPEFKPPKDKSG